MERPSVHHRGHRRPRAGPGRSDRGACPGAGSAGDRRGRCDRVRGRRDERDHPAGPRGRGAPPARLVAGPGGGQQGGQRPARARGGRVLLPRLGRDLRDQRGARAWDGRPAGRDRLGAATGDGRRDRPEGPGSGSGRLGARRRRGVPRAAGGRRRATRRRGGDRRRGRQRDRRRGLRRRPGARRGGPQVGCRDRGRVGGHPGGDRHRRASERRQVEPAQRVARRGAIDRQRHPGNHSGRDRHHPRLRSERGRPDRHGRDAPARQGGRRAWTRRSTRPSGRCEPSRGATWRSSSSTPWMV